MGNGVLIKLHLAPQNVHTGNIFHSGKARMSEKFRHLSNISFSFEKLSCGFRENIFSFFAYSISFLQEIIYFIPTKLFFEIGYIGVFINQQEFYICHTCEVLQMPCGNYLIKTSMMCTSGQYPGGTEPGFQLMLNIIILSVTNNHFSVQFHSGTDKTKLPPALSRLIEVHKINFNIRPDD